mmetsp:Transcript_75045/g.160784  ORF Transcript_75045/g.160784 Transcript_75045/m.160784 type:complete len:211 (+) Transcript_75045:572-1204(+)
MAAARHPRQFIRRMPAIGDRRAPRAATRTAIRQCCGGGGGRRRQPPTAARLGVRRPSAGRRAPPPTARHGCRALSPRRSPWRLPRHRKCLPRRSRGTGCTRRSYAPSTWQASAGSAGPATSPTVSRRCRRSQTSHARSSAPLCSLGALARMPCAGLRTTRRSSGTTLAPRLCRCLRRRRFPPEALPLEPRLGPPPKCAWAACPSPMIPPA